MKKTIEISRLVREVLGIIAIVGSGILWIYERGGKDEAKTAKEYQAEIMAKHADSLAILNFETQKVILFQLKQGQIKDSAQMNEISKFRESIKTLGNKILTKDEFIKFIDPYLSQKKNSKPIQLCQIPFSYK